MIIARMLSTINDSGSEGANKTSIMYKSFLYYAQLKEYLSFLLEKHLIDEIPRQTESHHVMKNLYTNNRKRSSLAADFSRNLEYSRS
jgi:predicted transcriptional regulator